MRVESAEIKTIAFYHHGQRVLVFAGTRQQMSVKQV